jgi:hypothetical protein
MFISVKKPKIKAPEERALFKKRFSAPHLSDNIRRNWHHTLNAGCRASQGLSLSRS